VIPNNENQFACYPSTTSHVQNSSQWSSENRVALNPSSSDLKAESFIVKLRDDKVRFATSQLIAVVRLLK
jgi:hypothetical protein